MFNFQKELQIPKKKDKKQWSTQELNNILLQNLASVMMKTFGCIKWEHDMFIGKPKARCYPFAMEGYKFRSKNPKVFIFENYVLYVMSHVTSYMMSHVTSQQYMMSHVIHIHKPCPLTNCDIQDCVCLIAPFPFNDQPPELFNPATEFDMSGAGKIWYARPQHFSLAWCVLADNRPIRRHIESFPLYSSTHLIQFNCRQKALCMRRAFQCCVRTLQARFQPCTFIL